MSQIDYLSEKGAETLARRIRAYWMKRGYVVEVGIRSVGGDARGTAYGLYSDMVNGLPQSPRVEGVAA